MSLAIKMTGDLRLPPFFSQEEDALLTQPRDQNHRQYDKDIRPVPDGRVHPVAGYGQNVYGREADCAPRDVYKIP